MKRLSILLLALVAGAHGGLFVQDGQEYVYESSATAGAGTMDYAPHMSGMKYKMKVRIQVRGKTLNVKISDLEISQYVGAVENIDNPFEKTTSTPDPAKNLIFSITSDDNGKFSSLSLPGGLTSFEKNLIKGWAAQLQINAGEIRNGKKSFISNEQTLHGDCDISYTVTDNAIYKTVAHMKDCKNRRFRLLDDWRGQRCDIDYQNPHRHENTGGLFSESSTVYNFEKQGSAYVIKKMETTGSIVAQFFESEGVSHFSWVKITSELIEQNSSSGDISASGETIDNLQFEFSDSDYKWNLDRDLKAREPFFSSGDMADINQADVKKLFLQLLESQKDVLHNLENTPDAIQRAHQKGIQNLYPVIYTMDYDTLMSLANELQQDKSDEGVMKSNLYFEVLGAAGTTAAALAIRDLVMGNKFDNDRDAARVLSAVPFHIRRPNTQLVKEYEKLLSFTGVGSERFVEMSIPLTFGHLVHITCMRAGDINQVKECFSTFATTYVSKFWDDYKNGNDREDKSLALAALQNIRFGGVSDKLKPLIYGEMDGESDEMRVQAIWAAGWDAFMSGKGRGYFMPIFADKSNAHDIRIAAVTLVFYSKPTSTDLGTILAVLKTETDYEVINYVFTLMEMFANSINPCDQKTAEVSKYFLKYLKQYSQYETDWKFGVSKVYMRQFHKDKFGYTGTYTFYSIGSHKSTTPLGIGAGIGTNLFHSYNDQMLSVHLRIEGLAKGLVRKFKTMDPSVWKTDDLQNIFSHEMNIRERPDQPVRVALTVILKGFVVFKRVYDETSTKEGGKFTQFVEGITSLDETYSINHQRAFAVGGLIYEQPTEVGVPMTYMNGITTMADIRATVKKGILRGLIYRNVEYDLHFFTQGSNIMTINPTGKVAYGIIQDRIYQAHFPRKLVIGLNPSRKELKLSIERPAYEDPMLLMMHSQTVVLATDNLITRKPADIKESCPSCDGRVVVSKGSDAVHKREFANHESDKYGYYLHGEYFDCELDISRGNMLMKAINPFLPYNKNPKDLWTSISMGIRQTRAFLLFFPKAEKCGVMFRWSQSRTNPVKEIEVSLRAQVESNGERMFFRGRKWLIRAIVKAIGDSFTRSYRLSVSYDFTPGYIQNRFKLMVNRVADSSNDISPYAICVAYESKYPEFSQEFLGVDFDLDKEVNGKALLQYGEGSECGDGEGEIRLKFRHTTTRAAIEDLKKKWYYQQCMDAYDSPAWKGRAQNALPVSEACYMTAYDATNARKYTWNIEFAKLTNGMRSIISKVRGLIRAGLTPYSETDSDDSDVNGDSSPFLNIEAILHNNDRLVDIKTETSQGTRQYKDYPLSLDWTKRLRNLKFTKTVRNLMNLGILNPCIATSETVRTNDNVTYPVTFTDCWTLVSGHCGPNPTYAVFTKRTDGHLPLAFKAFIGGHSVEINPSGPYLNVLVNGSPVSIPDTKEHELNVEGQEIFRIYRWGSTYNIYSFLKVWLVYDGNFIEVMPAPSVKGQHCGVCGNYNRNKFDDFMGKNENLIPSSNMVEEWKWQC